MSEVDLPARFAKYDGDHIKLKRIALTVDTDCAGLPSFPAADKRKDPRYKWFVANYGDRCWELDAMDPNDLRDCVETGDQGVDRACGVATVRGRQQGGASIAQDRS